MAEASWRRRWRWLCMPLALAAFAWTVWLLWGALPALYATLPRLKLCWLLLILCGNVVSGYLGFEAFRALFDRARPGLYQRRSLAHLYFAGQLLKHLPGRIWGVAYQSSTGHRATVAEWIGVTTVYMMLSSGFALWVAMGVLGFMHGWVWGLLALASGGAIYVLLWRRLPLIALLNLLRKFPLRALARLCDAIEPFADVDARFKRVIWCWFITSWLVYLLAWTGYGLAWPSLNASDGVWLCAIYTVAWFAGYISLVSPSGVGVRELVFVLLAHRFPPDAVAGMAVLGRVVLLFVDILLGAIFISFKAAGK